MPPALRSTQPGIRHTQHARLLFPPRFRRVVPPVRGHHTICPKPYAKKAKRSGALEMRGSSVGEKIGEGAYADVHAWAPGQVVKLFKAGFPRRHSWWETRMTRAVFAAGAPAPEVFDEVTVEGRFGVVLQRLD